MFVGMKKTLLALALLCLFSCKKDTETLSIDVGLLKKYNWQYINNQKQTINNQEVSYSDTISYSFSGNNFQRKIQNTTLLWTIGSWPQNSQVLINQKTYTSIGQYELNMADSTLTFIQKSNGATIADSLAYYIPRIGDVVERDSLIKVKVKILQLDGQTLKIASILNNQYVFHETYNAVSK